MLFHTINIHGKEYKCALNMRALVEAEKRLGENPLDMLMSVTQNALPSFEKLMVLFHESLTKYNHGITMDEVYDIYDEYVEDGRTFADFMAELIEIMKTSGLIGEEKKGKGKIKSEKN